MVSKDERNNRIIEEAKKVLSIEYQVVRSLISKIDESFVRAIDILYNCEGRIIVTGMGKSGLIGKKISSTFSSTGTPTFFLHPAEGGHGDIGVVTADDVVIAISHSGNTEEVMSLLPFFKRFGIKVIAITGDPDSILAKNSDVCLDVGVEKEACPLGITPTASTTATLVMGDALAMVLLKLRGFKKEDFALFHPAGSLGKRLLLRVGDLMHRSSENPVVNYKVSLKEAIYEMTSKGLGMTSVVDGQNRLVGIVTDGDLRRILEREKDPLNIPVGKLMIRNPKVIGEDVLAAEALRVMEYHSITSLIVIDDENRPYGTLHLHDILKAGIA